MPKAKIKKKEKEYIVTNESDDRYSIHNDLNSVKKEIIYLIDGESTDLRDINLYEIKKIDLEFETIVKIKED